MAIICVLLARESHACEAMLGTEYADPPEMARMVFDSSEWHVAYRQRTPDYALREYVRAPDAIQSWQQLVTWQVSFGSRAGSLTDQEERLLERLRGACPRVQQRGVPAPIRELRFEWWHSGCRGEPARHELVRLVEGVTGIHTLTYARRGDGMPDLERAHWWERLGKSRIELRGTSSGSPELHTGRVALWRGGYTEARRLLEPLAQQGLAPAQVELAGLYAEGWGVSRDYARALALLESAAAQQDRDAELRLGRMYEEGWGVSVDVQKALSWYSRAADHGSSEAQTRAGLVAIFGDVLLSDFAAGVRFFVRGAEGGNPEAKYWLGYAYERAWSVDRDFGRAAALYREAAEAGDPNGQFRLGVAYEYGFGLERNRDEARKWYQRAALQGVELAQLALRDRFSEAE